MYKSNLQRNGQAGDVSWDVGIGGIQWRLKNIQLLSSDKSIVFDSGSLYCIATRDNPLRASFYSISAESGQVNWSIEIDKENRPSGDLDTECFSAPTIVDKLAFFLYKPTRPRFHPVLFCVDIESQKIKFSTDIHTAMGKHFVDGTIDQFKRLLRSSTLVVEDSVYIGTGNGCICSFDVDTGNLNWTLTLTDEFAIGHLAYADGFLYAQSGNRDVYAVNIRKRSVRWKFEHGEDYEVHINWYDICPLILGDIIYVYGSLKNLYAIERKTGKLIWKYGVSGFFVCRNFVAADNILVGIMPDNVVHAVDARTGQKVWTVVLGDTITGRSPSVVVRDAMFVGSGGYFYKVCASTGRIKQRWEIPFDLRNTSNPLYLFVQLANSVTKITTGSPGFSSISSPCITDDGIFLATETAPDFSIYKLDIRTAPTNMGVV